MSMSEAGQLRSWAFIGLLIGGILIIVGGLMGTAMMGAAWPMGMGAMSGMMGTYVSEGQLATMSWWMGAVGTVTGTFVLIAAYHVYRGRKSALWSVVAIVAGALSLFAMGGYVFGAVAAIAGGALGLLDREQEAPRAGGA